MLRKQSVSVATYYSIPAKAKTPAIDHRRNDNQVAHSAYKLTMRPYAETPL